MRCVACIDIRDYSIGQSEEDLGRMLEVLRFWFTKDLVWDSSVMAEELADSGRNMSRENLANPTIQCWESSSGSVSQEASQLLGLTYLTV
jgi:hypothetical protein